MALCDILVCLDATAAGDGRLELALNLAQASKAYLTVVYTLPEARGAGAAPAGPGLPPTVLGPVSPDGASAIGGQPIIATRSAAQVPPEAERADTLEQRFREELPLRELDGEWHMLNRIELAELIQLAKAADLAILGQYQGHDSNGVAWLRPDDVMIDVGRPVLIVPCAGVFERVGRRVLIAWDGTREANRALHDALPVISTAEAVTVIHVGAQQADLDRDRPSLERIVRHLGRHAIEAQPEESLHVGVAIRDALLSRAADLGADMIVVGAYHHSPLRESLLGGVSRGLLDHMTIPVLMSH
jgi:nucleotide-binding universal stress UspA family protein